MDDVGVMDLVLGMVESKCNTCLHKYNSESLESLHAVNLSAAKRVQDNFERNFENNVVELERAKVKLKELHEFVMHNTDWVTYVNRYDSKIAAIKNLIEITTLSMRDAKDLVDKHYVTT